MKVIEIKNSVDFAYGYDAGSPQRDVVVHILDAQGNLVSEKALAAMEWDAGGELLAPQSPYQSVAPKLIIKIQQ